MMRHEVRRAGWMVAAGLACAVVLVPALVSAQDLTLKNTTTVNGKTAPGAQYITPTATRTSLGNDTDVIVRLDQKKFYSVDGRKRTYSEMSFDDMQKAVAQATGAMDNLPPEAAAQMKKFMGGMGGDVTVTPMGPGETIAGYPTEKYHVTMGTIMEIDMWAAPSLALPAMHYDAMKAVMPANPMLDMKKIFDAYKKIKGVPMKTVSTTKMMGQTISSTMVVTAVEKGPIPASVFEPPAGFKLVQMK